MVEPDESERLKRLQARIDAVRGTPAPEKTQEHYSQAQVGWRMVTEMVAGLGIGFAIGLGLDTLFGTKPILMVVFLFLGLAAGIKTMMRTAGELTGPPAGRNETGGAAAPQDGTGAGASHGGRAARDREEG